MTCSEVLIVGAGPTGLALALWLTKLGVKIRIVDKTAEPGTTSHGHKVPAVRLWVKGKPKARVSFEEIGGDLTPYPFLQIFPQDQHERLLIARLQELGVSVERQTELLSYRATSSSAKSLLRRAGPRANDLLA
jgi:flavin-dependent dehydrogenase